MNFDFVDGYLIGLLCGVSVAVIVLVKNRVSSGK